MTINLPIITKRGGNMRIKLECRCGSKIEIEDGVNTKYENKYGSVKTGAETIVQFVAEQFAIEHKGCLAVPDCNNDEQVKVLRVMAKLVGNVNEEKKDGQ